MGILAPSAWNFFGFSRNSLISWNLLDGLVRPGDVLNVTFGESGDMRFARLLSKLITFDPPPCIWFMRKIQKPIRSTNGSEVDEQRPPGRRPGALRVELDVLLREQILNCVADCGVG